MRTFKHLFLWLTVVASASAGCTGRQHKEIGSMEAVAQSIAITMHSAESRQMAAADKRFAAMFDYIGANDLTSLDDGRYDIDGDDLYLIIVTAPMHTAEEAVLEAHDCYYDVQIPLLQAEEIAVADRKACVAQRGKADEENDIVFFEDKPQRTVTVAPHSLLVVPPQVAHAPMIGEGVQRKAIFKIKIADNEIR